MTLRVLLQRPIMLIASFLCGGVCLVLSGMLLIEHARVVREVRDVSLPLVAQITTLETRSKVLKEQVDLSQLQSAVSVGSLGEKLEVFVFPSDPAVDRAVAFFDLVGDALFAHGYATPFEDIAVETSPVAHEDGLAAFPLTLKTSLSTEGLETLLRMVDLLGLLTVGDALTSDDIALLFLGSEEENPAGIVALEQFLSQDLLRYALDPRSTEEQLRRSFVSPTFSSALQTTLQSSLLRDARRLLGGDLGQVLLERNIWPQQFLTVEHVRLTQGQAPGWYAAELTVFLWGREYTE
ncbi:hypothetical protein COU80_05200 [Candidatus Peregrinibacteria bacterium CG10_big_fil_rev_8_21_14_0_10_55_24]|nr:MAG: hypothetical protein COU80_05200 [Candidatus Peregrinibacteria bacterium CG10_big_fil_rev_8_21_14_0_10_55_24]